MQVDRATKARALHHFKAMIENDFSRKVLVPFFKSIGYFDVDFNGGPNEEGKDLICWKEDELGGYSLTTAQVKRLDYRNRRDERVDLRELIQQLQDAARRPVIYKDNLEYFASTVYFITPYEVDTRLLRSVLVERSNVSQIKIIDGNLLLGLLEKHAPSILIDAAGGQAPLTKGVDSTLGSVTLMRALNRDAAPELSYFYNHLNFSVGNVTTALFFEFDFSAQDTEVVIKENWEVFKDAVERIESYFGIELTTPKVSDEDRRYFEQRKLHGSIQNRRISGHINKLSETIEINCEDFSQQIKQLRDALTGRQTKEGGQAIDHVLSVTREAIRVFESDDPCSGTVVIRFSGIMHELQRANEDLDTGIELISELIRQWNNIEAQLSERREWREKYVPEPEHKVTVHATTLAAKIREVREYIKEQAALMSEEGYSNSDVAAFLSTVKADFSAVDNIFLHDAIPEVLGLAKKNLCFAGRFDYENRFTLSLHHVFDSGQHIAVFGEAGAGKTTTLSKYAKDLAELQDIARVPVFLPLNRIAEFIERIERRREASDTEEPSSLSDTLLRAMVSYFHSEGSGPELDELTSIFRSRRIVLICDGVDEAIKTVPWLIEGVEEICEEFDKVQVILSSRMIPSISRKVRFLCVSLLPFTEAQRDRFISGWFSNNETLKCRVLQHVRSSDIGAIVLSPLLAAILCALAENSVPLPGTEKELYSRRMRLLAGYYDSQKGISRNKFEVEVLLEVARKAAYVMHERKTREVGLEELAESILGYINYRRSLQLIKDVLGELVSPCNIMAQVDSKGRIGFGHLRYQEYLVAEELGKNRSINILPLLTSPWWRGALVMYSRFLDDLSFILDEVYEKRGVIGEAYDTLKAMIEAQPYNTRDSLGKLLDRIIEQDRFDEGLTNLNEDGWYDEDVSWMSMKTFLQE